MLTGLSVFMLTSIVKLTFKLINSGTEDEKIKEEFLATQGKAKKCKGIDFVVSILLCSILCVVFIFSITLGFRDKIFSESVPTLKVVNSASMSKKHEKNTYLVENNLNDHIQTFDLIFTYQAPSEFDLKVFDIVVYEVDGVHVIHRIVQIEEPNEAHPNERWFRCQGDAVETPDRFPVRYSQIKGIYRGQRIPMIGSFITFMQSPAGWLCIILVVAAMIITPLLENAISKARYNRFLILCPSFQVAVADDQVDVKIKRKKLRLNFKQRLKGLSKEMFARFNLVEGLIKSKDGVAVVESMEKRRYKQNGKPVAIIRITGKTVMVYVATDHVEYKYSKYVFFDVSGHKGYKLYPMRFKLISDKHTQSVLEVLEQKFYQLEHPTEAKSEVQDDK